MSVIPWAYSTTFTVHRVWFLKKISVYLDLTYSLMKCSYACLSLRLSPLRLAILSLASRTNATTFIGTGKKVSLTKLLVLEQKIDRFAWYSKILFLTCLPNLMTSYFWLVLSCFLIFCLWIHTTVFYLLCLPRHAVITFVYE